MCFHFTLFAALFTVQKYKTFDSGPSYRFREVFFFRFTEWGRSSLYERVNCSLSEKIKTAKGKFYLSAGAHPCILGPMELARAKQVSGPLNFFANKFDETIDSSGMDMLDRELDHYKLTANEVEHELPWVERAFPHPLHCPKYHGAGV